MKTLKRDKVILNFRESERENFNFLKDRDGKYVLKTISPKTDMYDNRSVDMYFCVKKIYIIISK